jgi:hypothetical protein
MRRRVARRPTGGPACASRREAGWDRMAPGFSKKTIVRVTAVSVNWWKSQCVIIRPDHRFG